MFSRRSNNHINGYYNYWSLWEALSILYIEKITAKEKSTKRAILISGVWVKIWTMIGCSNIISFKKIHMEFRNQLQISEVLIPASQDFLYNSPIFLKFRSGRKATGISGRLYRNRWSIKNGIAGRTTPDYAPDGSDLFDRFVSILEQARTNVIRSVNNKIVIAY
jgi:hypothetical protein